MSNSTDNVSDDISQEVSDIVDKGGRKVKQGLKTTAKKLGKKAMKGAANALGRTSIQAVLGWTLASLGIWLLIPLLIIILGCVVYLMYDSQLYETKTYSSQVEENSIKKENIRSFDESSQSSVSRLRSRSMDLDVAASFGDDSSDLDITSSSFSTVELSEGNQAIENYHYYKSTESVLNNKMYIATKGIDVEKKDKELFDELVKKGIIEYGGNEAFTDADDLTTIEENWKKKYGDVEFTWDNESTKQDLNSRINEGVTIKGFGDKYVGEVEEITDEKKKNDIKDAYGREEYFQLPEELLAALNRKIYGEEYIYDDPFVQAVKFKYKKKKDDDKAKDESTVNKKSAKNSYNAETFNKHFKENGILDGKGNLFITYAKKYDVDAALVVAIACKKSNYGTDESIKKSNNVFGVIKNGETTYYENIEDGIKEGIKNLASQCIGKGKTSLEEISKAYSYGTEWVGEVSSIYEKITGSKYSPKTAGKGIGIDATAFRSVPDYEFDLDTEGLGLKRSEYGLGSVFIYKPSINLEVTRGVEIKQVLKTTDKGKNDNLIKTYEEDYKEGDSLESVTGKTKDEDGEELNTITEYELIEKEVDGETKKIKKVSIYKVSKECEAVATANAVDDIKAEVVYVLDKVVTFAGVYEFEYELMSEEAGSENNISEREVSGTDGMKEVEMTETKTIKMYEKPTNVKSEKLTSKYMNKYLQNFRGVVPRHIALKFNVDRMVKAFKGVKGSSGESSESGSAESGSMTSDHENVEQWREIVEEIAGEYGIDPNIIMVTIYTESRGNPHNNNPKFYYWGLLSMGDDSIPKSLGGHDVYDYFSKSEITLDRGLMTDSRIPHCGPNGHNQAEHERAVRLNVEYSVKRLGSVLYRQSKKMFNKDPKDLTQDELFYTVAASICSYATGEGGQNSIRKVAGYDYAKLYSSPGAEWKKYHTLADQIRGGDLNSKFGMNRFLEEIYKNYSIFSGGTDFRESAQFYDIDKWFVLDKNKNVSGENASEGISTSSNGTNMDPQKVKNYLEYEVYGKILSTSEGKDNLEENKENKNIKEAPKGTVVTSLTGAESADIRDAAIAMIKQKSTFEVDKKDQDDVFWGNGFASKYFVDGLQARPLYGDALSRKTWATKIRESTVYTGGTNSILDLARSYGKDVYLIVKRALELDGTKYKNGANGPKYFDDAGMLWYVFNSNSQTDYFGKGTVKDHYEKLTLEVAEGDIRPADVVFYSNDKDKDEPNKIAIYLGNKAYLGVNESEGELEIANYTIFRENENVHIKGVRRVIKSGSGDSATIEGVGGLPADLISGDWIDPLYKATYSGSSNFGMRMHPTLHKWKFHRGLDMAAGTGQIISAAKTGKVLKASMYGTYGNCVILDHGDSYTTLYAHMSSISVSVGDIVKQGEEIGKVGSTGRSTGPHLHFEIAYQAPGHTTAKEGVYPSGNYLDPRTVIKSIKK